MTAPPPENPDGGAVIHNPDGGAVGPRHDQYFKKLLESPERARIFLQERLAPAVVERIDWRHPPQPAAQTFIDAGLRVSESDLLFTLRRQSGDPSLVYVLLEHKSRRDRFAPLQILRYMTAIWTRLADQRAAPPLPPILPLVVHHGPKAWRGQGRLSDLFTRDEAFAAALPDFAYGVVDLQSVADGDLSAAPDVRAGLMALKYAYQASRQVAALTPLLRALENDQDLALVTLRYILNAWEQIDYPDLLRAADHLQRTSEPTMVSLAARHLLEQGRQEGRQEGREEGELIGQGKSLLRFLHRRFGPAADGYAEQIGKADAATLELWSDRAVDAPALTDVFRLPH